MTVVVTGIDKVMKNLSAKIKRIEGATLAGLIRAAIMIRRDMDKKEPLVPADWGNLRASCFIAAMGHTDTVPRWKGPADIQAKVSAGHPSVVNEQQQVVANSGMPMVAIGFSAYYAWYVHENITAVNWQRPGSGAKFLEAAVKNNRDNIPKMIEKEARKTK